MKCASWMQNSKIEENIIEKISDSRLTSKQGVFLFFLYFTRNIQPLLWKETNILKGEITMLNLLTIIVGIALGIVLAYGLVIAAMLVFPQLLEAVMERYMKICYKKAEKLLNDEDEV